MFQHNTLEMKIRAGQARCVRAEEGGGGWPQENQQPTSIRAAAKRAGDTREGRNLNENIWSYVL
jgi:hypothetical protein